jgi:hypothetical protein
MMRRAGVRWSFTVLFVALSLVWLLSRWLGVRLATSDCTCISVRSGLLVWVRFYGPRQSYTGLNAGPFRPGEWCWWFQEVRGNFVRSWGMPLWVIVLPLGGGATAAWIARRGSVPGHCSRCGYDRRGLVGGAKCPECGTVPTRG